MKIQHYKTQPFKKAVLVSAIVVTCSASTNTLANDSCNLELEAGLTIDVNSIEFFSESTKKTLYKIENDTKLIIADKKIDLNNQQQKLLTEYSSSIKALVPRVRSIAIEGVDIALEGVNLTFNELLGEGNNVSADLTRELSDIRDDLAQRFTLEHGFTLGADGLAHNEILGADVERRLEAAIEKAVMNSMGSLMMAVGKEMMSSGGNSESFEKRMEAFAENIEHEMELRAEKIEHKAEKLCGSILQIDQLEEQLKASIAPLAGINVISASHTKRTRHDRSAM